MRFHYYLNFSFFLLFLPACLHFLVSNVATWHNQSLLYLPTAKTSILKFSRLYVISVNYDFLANF